jgi:hypothetical protein
MHSHQDQHSHHLHNDQTPHNFWINEIRPWKFRHEILHFLHHCRELLTRKNANQTACTCNTLYLGRTRWSQSPTGVFGKFSRMFPKPHHILNEQPQLAPNLRFPSRLCLSMLFRRKFEVNFFNKWIELSWIDTPLSEGGI